MSTLIRSTNIRNALRAKQRGFLLNPYRFGIASSAPIVNPDSGVTSAPLVMWIDPSDAAYRNLTSSVVNSLTCKKSGLVYAKGGTAPTLNPGGTGLITVNHFLRDSVDFGDSSASYLYNAIGVPVTPPFHAFIVTYWGNRLNNSGGLFINEGPGPISPVDKPYLGVFRATTPSTTIGNYRQLYSSSPLAYGTYTNESTPAKSKMLVDYYTPANITSLIISRNGVEVPGTRTLSGTSTGVQWKLQTLGSADTAYVANGAYGEILVYTGTLSPADVIGIRDYLKTRWGTP